MKYPEELLAERVAELETALKTCIDQLDKACADSSKAWDHAADYQKRLFKALIALRNIEDQTDTDPETMWIADIARAALGDKQ